MKEFISHITTVVELAGVIVILCGAFMASYQYLRRYSQKDGDAYDVFSKNSRTFYSSRS